MTKLTVKFTVDQINGIYTVNTIYLVQETQMWEVFSKRESLSYIIDGPRYIHNIRSVKKDDKRSSLLLLRLCFYGTNVSWWTFWTCLTLYIVDVLWGQPIKLIQVASNSELHENQWNNLFFSLKLFPLIPSGPQMYKHKIGHKYFTFQHPKQFGAFFNH